MSATPTTLPKQAEQIKLEAGTVILSTSLASVEVPLTILKTEDTKDWVPMKGHQGLGSYEGKRRTERLGSYAE